MSDGEAGFLIFLFGLPLYALFIIGCWKAGEWMMTAGKCPECRKHKIYWRRRP